MFSKVMIQVLMVVIEHQRQRCFATLPWTCKQNNFLLNVLNQSFFQVPFHLMLTISNHRLFFT